MEGSAVANALGKDGLSPVLGDTNDARRLAAQLLVSAESGRVRPRDAFEHSAVRGVRAARCVASVGRTPPRPAYANDINEPNNRDFEFGQG
jgi:hypothetical protein